jgi:hypothetical protein
LGRTGAEVGEAGASTQAVYARLRRELKARRPMRRTRARAAARVLVAIGLVVAVVWLALRAGLGYALMVGTFLAQQLREGWRGRSTPDPARAWRRGAKGERRTAKRLRPLTQRGWVVLHDRAIPGFPGNVDHLVIGPSGVFVIDSKFWAGRAVTVAEGVLYVGGFAVDVRPTLWEAEQVGVALADELVGTHTAVVPVICVHGAFFPGDGHALGALDVVPGRELRRYVQRPRAGHLHRAAIVRLAAAAEARLPAAS